LSATEDREANKEGTSDLNRGYTDFTDEGFPEGLGMRAQKIAKETKKENVMAGLSVPNGIPTRT
jgi:hypothetical protein